MTTVFEVIACVAFAMALGALVGVPGRIEDWLGRRRTRREFNAIVRNYDAERHPSRRRSS